MNVLIGFRDNHTFPPASPERERWRAGMAIMPACALHADRALPDKGLSLFDFEKLLKPQNTASWPPARLRPVGDYAPEGRAYASEGSGAHLLEGIVAFRTSGDFIDQPRMLFDIHVLSIASLILDVGACAYIITAL
jgi:hypothetical protein